MFTIFGHISTFALTYTFDPGTNSALTPAFSRIDTTRNIWLGRTLSSTVTTVDPRSQLLVVANNAEPNENLYVFNVGNEGSLASLQGSPYTLDSVNTGSDAYMPQSAVFDASSGYLYVSATNWSGTDRIYEYRVDRDSNALVALEPPPGSTNPFPVASSKCYDVALQIDVSGKYLYVYELSCDLSGNVSVFSIDGNTGLLSPFGAPATIAAPAASLGTFDPSGRFLFFFQSDGTLDEYQPLLNPEQATLSRPSFRFATGLEYADGDYFRQRVIPLQ